MMCIAQYKDIARKQQRRATVHVGTDTLTVQADSASSDSVPSIKISLPFEACE